MQSRRGVTFGGRLCFHASDQQIYHMKTIIVIALFIAFAASAVITLGFEISASVLVAAGLLGIMISDYTRRSRLLRVPVMATAHRRTERFGLAA
jgi:hypothetical protein